MVLAPGARAGQICSVLSLAVNLAVPFFPYSIFTALPLGVGLAATAFVLHRRARGLATASPERYSPLDVGWMAPAIVGLIPAMLVILALPSLWSSRARARNYTSNQYLADGFNDMASQFDQMVGDGTPPQQIPARFESRLRSDFGKAENPWNAPVPAFDLHFHVVQGIAFEEVERMARNSTQCLGQVVFVIELPNDQHPGYLAGAVRIKKVGASPEVLSSTAETH